LKKIYVLIKQEIDGSSTQLYGKKVEEEKRAALLKKAQKEANEKRKQAAKEFKEANKVTAPAPATAAATPATAAPAPAAAAPAPAAAKKLKKKRRVL
jgi:hypothetical protein